MNIVSFPAPMSEIERIADDHCPPSLTKKEMISLIGHAYTKTEDFSHPFLFINTKKPFNERYRKGFHIVLSINE
jgi:hypothetical protein